MTTSASLCEGPIFYFYLLPLYKSHGDLHLSFLHFILWQAQCVGKILIYIYPIGCKLARIIIVDITLEVKGWEAKL